MAEDKIDCGFIVGYGGWAAISDSSVSIYDNWYTGNTSFNITGFKRVKVIGASISRSMNIPVVNSYYLPPDDTSSGVKSAIRTGFGTYTYNGQISMELSNACFNFINSNCLIRNKIFGVEFYDGEQYCSITNCVWNSIQISGSANAIPTVSISFQSNNGGKQALNITSSSISGCSNDDATNLISYWQTGVYNINASKAIKVTDFSFSLERNVQPVFLNNNLHTPTYLRPGLINASLSFTAIDTNDVHLSTNENKLKLILGNGSITINKAVLQNQSYQDSTLNDVGNKTYQFVSFGGNDSKYDAKSSIITITKSTSEIATGKYIDEDDKFKF